MRTQVYFLRKPLQCLRLPAKPIANEKWNFTFKVFLTFLILLSIPVVMFCTREEKEHLRIERLNMEHGLSHNNIKCIFQDSSGLMWFGTENGLNSYDGYDFKVYLYENLPTAQFIVTIAEDRSGNLWLGTQSTGILKFNKYTGTFAHFMHNPKDPDSLCSNEVTIIYPSDRQETECFWVGTRDGLSRMTISPNGNPAFKNYRHQPGQEARLASDRIWSLVEMDLQGVKSLWIGTENGLSRWTYQQDNSKNSEENDKDFLDFQRVEGLNGHSINVLCPVNTSEVPTLWVGTTDGLFRLTRDAGGSTRLRCYRHQPGDSNSLSDSHVIGIGSDNQSGILWIGTFHEGVNQFNPTTETFSHYKHDPLDLNSLSDSRVRALYLDRSGILWVGTAFDGVNKIVYGPLKLKFKTHRPQPGNNNSLSHNLVRCFLEEPGTGGNILWIGTEGGLNRWARKTNGFTHYTHNPEDPDSIGDNRVYCLHFDASGTLYAGTANGLYQRDKTGKFRQCPFDIFNPSYSSRFFLRPSVRSIHEDQKGMMWIGTIGGGIIKFDPKDKTYSYFRHDPSNPNSLAYDSVYIIYETREKGKEILWFGTYGRGMDRFDPETGAFTHYTHDPLNPNSIGGDLILCIRQGLPGPDGTPLWIGAYGGGLTRFDPKSQQFVRFTMKDGLRDNTVYGILNDDNGNLWLSTNLGISKFNPRQKVFKNYYVTDGLQGAEFNGGAYYKTANGEMFFGGFYGFNVFHPSSIKENLNIPPMVLTVTKNFKEIAFIDASNCKDKEIHLSSKDEVISFRFAALDYLNPRQNLYAYKLENFDKDWIECGTSRMVNYTHMAPGHYIFRVKGSNSDNVWNETGISVKMVVVPIIWETSWFKMLIGLVGLTVLILLYRSWIMARQRKILKQQVAERTKELRISSENAREMALRAESANRAKSRFLTNISHEIRTPISGIIGITDLIQKASLPEQQQSYFDMIKKSAHQLMGVLDEILDFSKIEAGQLNLENSLFELPPLLNEIKNHVYPQVERKGLKYNVFVQDNVPDTIIGDAHRLKQILLNLVGNAVKFTEKGSVTISVKMSPGEEDTLHFSISDTGIGIPVDRQQHIFESFTQVDTSMSRQHTGTGLGLAIARQLVELMKGKIWFESQPLQGSTFHFTYLFQRQETREKQEITEKTGKEVSSNSSAQQEDENTEEKNRLISQLSRLKQKVRILVVEDNPINRKVASRQIQLAGIPVEEVADGKLAIEAVKTKKYHLILMDVQMPHMDGLTATKIIRQELEKRDIIIVAMTAHAMKGDKQDCLDAGMNDYITKPFKPVELYRVLIKWLCH